MLYNYVADDTCFRTNPLLKTVVSVVVYLRRTIGKYGDHESFNHVWWVGKLVGGCNIYLEQQ